MKVISWGGEQKKDVYLAPRMATLTLNSPDHSLTDDYLVAVNVALVTIHLAQVREPSSAVIICFFLSVFIHLFFMVLGIEPRILCVLDKYFTPEPAAVQNFKARVLAVTYIPILQVRVQRLGEVESL